MIASQTHGATSIGTRSNHNLNLSANDSTKVTITTAGNVGVGTTSPSTLLELSGSGNTVLTINTGNNSGDNSTLAFGDSADADVGFINYDHGTHIMQFAVAASERMRVDSDGDLLVGLTTALSTQAGSIQAAGPIIAKSYINAHTSNATVIEYLSNISRIRAYGATSGSGLLAFNTGGGGGATDSEAMRIHTSGNVAIGATNGSARLLVARDIADSASNSFDNQTVLLTGTIGGNSTNNRTGLYFAPHNSSNQYSPSAITCTAGSNYQSTLKFFVNGAGNGTGHLTSYERMRIDSSGRVGIGTASPDHLLHCEAASAVAKFNHTTSGNTTGIVMRHARGGLSGFTGKMISFIGNDSTEEGSIVIGTTATAFNTSSDYRLKENETAISDGITKLKQLKPYRFNFKKDPDVKVDGFFAHEVASVVPVAVTGEKDAMKPETRYVESDTIPSGKFIGDPKTFSTTEIDPQQIDHSKLVPLLVAALQEAIGRIEVLEAK